MTLTEWWQLKQQIGVDKNDIQDIIAALEQQCRNFDEIIVTDCTRSCQWQLLVQSSVTIISSKWRHCRYTTQVVTRIPSYWVWRPAVASSPLVWRCAPGWSPPVTPILYMAPAAASPGGCVPNYQPRVALELHWAVAASSRRLPFALHSINPINYGRSGPPVDGGIQPKH